MLRGKADLRRGLWRVFKRNKKINALQKEENYGEDFKKKSSNEKRCYG